MLEDRSNADIIKARQQNDPPTGAVLKTAIVIMEKYFWPPINVTFVCVKVEKSSAL